MSATSVRGGAIWWTLTKEGKGWYNLQVKLCDPRLSALSVWHTKMALCKYSSFPFAFPFCLVFIFGCLTTTFYRCPAKHCGNVAPLHLWGRLLPNSLNTRKSSPDWMPRSIYESRAFCQPSRWWCELMNSGGTVARWKLVGHKKKPTCFCLQLRQKWTDFNAVFTLRF